MFSAASLIQSKEAKQNVKTKDCVSKSGHQGYIEIIVAVSNEEVFCAVLHRSF